MLSWFVPKEAKFFDMFRESADIIVEGSKALVTLLNNLDQVELHASIIKDLEHKADKVTHKAVEALHMTFITPLDRDEIYQLVTKMDDILDLIDAAAQRFQLYDIRKSTPEIIGLAQIIEQAANDVKVAVAGLEGMKNTDEILKRCQDINRWENDADHILRIGMAKLFREEISYKDLIKYKEVYEILESVTDSCEDVANIVEGIVLDHN